MSTKIVLNAQEYQVVGFRAPISWQKGDVVQLALDSSIVVHRTERTGVSSLIKVLLAGSSLGAFIYVPTDAKFLVERPKIKRPEVRTDPTLAA